MTTPMLQILPTALRRKRLELALSRQQLADRSDVSYYRISQLEGGFGIGVRPETVSQLADALGCPPSEISEVVPEEVAL